MLFKTKCNAHAKYFTSFYFPGWHNYCIMESIIFASFAPSILTLPVERPGPEKFWAWGVNGMIFLDLKHHLKKPGGL
jgi:hypothetical protein